MSTSTVPVPATPSKALHGGLWAAQILLALVFLGAGTMKATQPIDALATQMAWVNHAPAALVRFIGVAEVAGALGLVLPTALRIAPRLTPLAAGLLTFTMVCGAATHAAMGEAPIAVVPLTLGALTAFVAWGRAVAAPVAAR